MGLKQRGSLGDRKCSRDGSYQSQEPDTASSDACAHSERDTRPAHQHTDSPRPNTGASDSDSDSHDGYNRRIHSISHIGNRERESAHPSGTFDKRGSSRTTEKGGVRANCRSNGSE